MSSTSNVEEQVLSIVANTVACEVETLSLDTRLFAGGLDLDSLTAVRILSALEQELGVALDEDDLNLAALESIGTLARFAASQLAPAG